MKQIPLTRGQMAIVDDKDYESLSQWKWQCTARGYAIRTGRKADGALRGSGILMHRQIMDAPQGLEVDHVNGNRLDNQRGNLRVCTGEQNRSHITKRKGSRTYKGARPLDGHWVAYLTNGKGNQEYLGFYRTEEEAAIAYNRRAREIWGERAVLNDIEDHPIEALSFDRRTRAGASGVYGVVWDKARNKWRAKLRRGKKHVTLGRYDEKEDAANAIRDFLEGKT